MLLLCRWLLLGSLIVHAFNEHGTCPNDCTGHGRCSQENACICDLNWKTAADCSQTTCPNGIAWTGKPQKPNTAHLNAECSNRGACDRNSGLCSCYDGYEGIACERLTCPNNCGDHGTCMTIGNIYKLYGTSMTLSSVYLSNSSAIYKGWDAEKLTQCICDWGYSGNSCEMRMCPKGDDPFTSFTNYRTITISLRTTSMIGGNVQLWVNGQVLFFPAYWGSWSVAQCEASFATLANVASVVCSHSQKNLLDSIGNVDWTIAFTKFPMVPFENNIYTNNGSLPLSTFVCHTHLITGTNPTCTITDITVATLPGKL